MARLSFDWRNIAIAVLLCVAVYHTVQLSVLSVEQTEPNSWANKGDACPEEAQQPQQPADAAKTGQDTKPKDHEMTDQEKYYNKKYFDEQKEMGRFGGKAKQYQVRDHIRQSDTVLDFGAGGGFFLHEMKCAKRVAVELNPFGLKHMEENFPEIVRYQYLEKVPNQIADVITSMSVLEHVEAPVMILRELYQKLKVGGIIILHVKNEGVLTDKKYSEKDWDQHLYTWNPSLFGNLVAAAGFKVEEIKAFQTAWPPNFQHLWDQLGEKEFLKQAEAYGRETNTWSIVLRARRVS